MTNRATKSSANDAESFGNQVYRCRVTLLRRGYFVVGSSGQQNWGGELFSPPRDASTARLGLRQVIAERSEHHVLDRLGGQGRGSRQGHIRRRAVADPGSFHYIRVLYSHLQPPFRTIVGLVPEPRRTLHNALDLAGAAGQSSGLEAARRVVVR